MAALLLSPRLEASLLVSEILTSNTMGLKDEDGQTSEWIELFNAGTNTQSLLGWSLTDDPAHAARWTFPATNLPPGSYLVVFAREKTARSQDSPCTRILGSPAKAATSPCSNRAAPPKPSWPFQGNGATSALASVYKPSAPI